MKIVMDERLKHRLIGLAVIISLGAIFAPAIMKKSSQHMENNFSVNVKLPPKPVAPDVASSDEKQLFETIKIAKIKLPPVSEENQLPELAKASSLSKTQTLAAQVIADEELPIKLASSDAAKSTLDQIRLKSKASLASNKKIVTKMPKVLAQKTPKLNITKSAVKAAKSDVYAVQLASFAKRNNAQSLVNRLKAKGYKASFAKVGNAYKVYAGHSKHKNDVLRTKTQLASVMQLKGFIVSTGIS